MTSDDHPRGESRLRLIPIALAVLILAWLPRSVDGMRHPYPEGPADPQTSTEQRAEGAWYTLDPDGLYHMRRVKRLFDEGLPVAGTDPYLSFPEGARIPWPPYYDAILWASLQPFVGSAEGREVLRDAEIERGVATAPLIFGLLTCLVAAACGWAVAGGVGALFAGTHQALSFGSINYSVLGAGDHHAFVSFASGLLVLLSAAALRGSALSRQSRSLAFGCAMGAVAGVLLGSWVASLLYVLQFELVLLWLLVRRAREEMPGAAALGLAFNATAAASILPAVVASPWIREDPWIVVNLSWFHPSLLLLGALFFLPPVLFERTHLRTGSKGARLLPFAAPGLAALVLALVTLLDGAPARGIREGFEWLTRSDPFMAEVGESIGLLDARGRGLPDLFLALGYLALAAPFAWGLIAWFALRGRRDILVPFAVVLPPLAWQAMQQRRFADAVALPLAVVLGFAAARLLRRLRSVPLRYLAALVLAILSQVPAVQRVYRANELARLEAADPQQDPALGMRLLYEWLRAQRPSGEEPEYSVLAHWDKGHLIEWAADSPSVATNFGRFVGEESFRDPASFFLSTDPATAGAILEHRRARYVLVTADLLGNMSTMMRIVDPQAKGIYRGRDPRAGGPVDPRWFETNGARLALGDGDVLVPGVGAKLTPLGTLRLVHRSPIAIRGAPNPMTGSPLPAGSIWEHVQGAIVEGRDVPGSELEIEIDVRYPGVTDPLHHRARAVADASGIARIRVPYGTLEQVGDGTVERARWKMGGREGALKIPEDAVRSGASVQVP